MCPILRVLFVLVACLPLSALARGTANFRLPSQREIAEMLRSPGLGQFVLSPDGRHLAYTHRQGDWLDLIILDLENPPAEAVVRVGENLRTYGGPFGSSGDRNVLRPRVTFLEWAAPNRLVVGTSVPARGKPYGRNPPPVEAQTDLLLLDGNGETVRTLIDHKDLYIVVSPLMQNADSPSRPRLNLIPDDPRKPAPPPTKLASEEMEWPIFPIRMRVIGIDPDDRGGVYVETITPPKSDVKVARIDFARGDRRVTYSYPGNPSDVGSELFYDQQCRPRLRLSPPVKVHNSRPITILGSEMVGNVTVQPIPTQPTPAPRTLRYRAAGEYASWTSWASLLGRESAEPFVLSAENFYAEQALSIGFDRNPDVLYIASNVGRDTYAIYRRDLRTSRNEPLFEEPGCDLAIPRYSESRGALVVDRQVGVVGVRVRGPASVRWIDQELAARQAELEDLFSGRRVDLIGWDDARRRFVVSVSSPADPGRIFLYHPGRADKLTEIMRYAPWLPAESLMATETFAFDSPAGVRLTGTLTLPQQTRISPPPLLLFCRDFGSWIESPPRFDARVHAFASMGFAVAQVNHRGTGGFGRQHRDAIKADGDRLPIEDLRATVAWLAAQKKINPRRVALFGFEFGGYLAMRAMQQHPREFRCAVALNAPVRLAKWVADPVNVNGVPWYMTQQVAIRRAFLKNTARPLREQTLLAPGSFQRPVFLMQDETRYDADLEGSRALINLLHQEGVEAEYREIPRVEPEDEELQAKVLTRVAAFLSAHVFDYSVELGDLKEVP